MKGREFLMSVCCGTDMVEVERIKKAIETHGERFLSKIFTNSEIEYCERKKSNKWLSFAARFAAKESVAKALGTGFANGVNPSDIEILICESGKPEVQLSNGALTRFNMLNGEDISVSLSHTDTHAIAMVVISHS
jgi:holo-[acyl-carrier protein] synthase